MQSDDRRKIGSGFKGIEKTQERGVCLGGMKQRVVLEALRWVVKKWDS